MATRPAYDLMVLIDAEAPDDRRAGIIDELKKQISSGGELKGDADWGLRKLAYEIDHRPEAHYHLFQLEATPELLNQLDRGLSINDAVLRHRIIKLDRGVPDETPRAPAPRYSEGRGEDQPAEQAPASAGYAAAPAEQQEQAPAEAAPAEGVPAEAAPTEPAPATSEETEQQPA